MGIKEQISNRLSATSSVLRQEDAGDGYRVSRSASNLFVTLLWGKPNVVEAHRRKDAWFGSRNSRNAFERKFVPLP